VIPPAVTARADATFQKIDAQTRDFERHGGGGGHDNWQLYGPRTDAFQPGVLAFSGADNTTASRITALLVSPRCGQGGCRAWAGAAGGGVWRTSNALASNPEIRISLPSATVPAEPATTETDPSKTDSRD
jgi:hypothetical protein